MISIRPVSWNLKGNKLKTLYYMNHVSREPAYGEAQSRPRGDELFHAELK